MDLAGNAYVTGYTTSADFLTAHPLAGSKPPSRGNVIAFVSKLNFDPRSSVLSLAYSTYLGGRATQQLEQPVRHHSLVPWICFDRGMRETGKAQPGKESISDH